jgi:hypothetical protein
MGQVLKGWNASPVVALTATPVVNEMSDILELLAMINPGSITSAAMSRFDLSMELLKRDLQAARKTFDELSDKVILDDQLKIASDNTIKRALFNLLWLKETLLDPLVEKVSWEDEEVQQLGKDKLPLVRWVKKDVEPIGQQLELIERVVRELRHSFLEKTDQIERCLMHPEFYTEKDIDTVIESFKGKDSIEKVEFLSQSATLQEVFLNEESELTQAIANNEKALIFVKHQKTAEFIRLVVQAVYGFDDSSVFVMHSAVANRDQIVENFKKITGRSAVLILLPKSGGVGLNFTNVKLNLMMTCEWTHEKDKQAKARTLRGVGERVIMSIRHQIPQRKHILNVVKKKHYFSRLMLPSSAAELRLILKTCESMVRSKEDNVFVTDEWKEFFDNQVDQIVARFEENAPAIECEYLEKRQGAAENPTKALFGYYISPSVKTRVYFNLIPMPDTPERPPFLRALQIGLAQCLTDGKAALATITEKIESGETITPQALAQLARANLRVENVGKDPQSCLLEIERRGLCVYIYEFSKGIWGSHLVRAEQKGLYTNPTNVIEILRDKDDYYLLSRNSTKNQPLQVIKLPLAN